MLPHRARCSTTFKHQGEESPLLRCEEIVHNAGLAQERPLCAFPSTDDSEGTAMLGKRTCFWTQQQWACAVHRRVQIYNGE
ncbi:hypothetical protein TNCV_1662381, partial [Trichonephila clavipes]